MKTLKQLAQEAIDVQNACNPLGVSKRYAAMLTELRAQLNWTGEPNDTDAIRRHPINRMWASKLHDLAGMGLSDMDRYSEAYHWCQEQVKGE